MGGRSSSSQSTTTTSYVDSFNTTYEQVLNVSNVGNIGLTVGAPPPASPFTSLAGPLIIAALALGGWLVLRH
jgi:hypothetical protein